MRRLTKITCCALFSSVIFNLTGDMHRAIANETFQPNKAAVSATKEKASEPWWKHAVFYEIYPRSFADAKNTGT